jgi:hypothetical protein
MDREGKMASECDEINYRYQEEASISFQVFFIKETKRRMVEANRGE